MTTAYLSESVHYPGTVWIVVIIVLILIYNMIMMAFYKKSDLRRHERYRVTLPIDIYDNGLIYKGEIENISEGGFAFFVNEAIYLPKEEELVEYRIHKGFEKIQVKGKVVHVDQRKNGWTYSIKLSELNEPALSEYMSIVYEQKKEKPFVLRNSFAFTMTKNLIARTKRRFTSKRATARIQVNEICDLKDGTVIILDNYNFEYIRISLVKGMLMENIVLFPYTSYEMYCTQSPWNPFLYSVDNQEELAQNEEFQELIKKWNAKMLNER